MKLTFDDESYETQLKDTLEKMLREPQIVRSGDKQVDEATGDARYVSTGKMMQPNDSEFLSALASSIELSRTNVDGKTLHSTLV